MQTSKAVVPTQHARRYLQQLAKHWGHKFPVQFSASEAVIELPFGKCRLDAAEADLLVKLSGAADADFDRFETVVAEHLQRFGHRETLVFDWRRGSAASG